MGSIQFDVEVYSKQNNFVGIYKYTLLELMCASFKYYFVYDEDKHIFNNLKNIMIEEF